MSLLSYQSGVSPAENLAAVVDYLCRLGGEPDGDGSPSLEVNGSVIDYYKYADKNTGVSKLGVEVRLASTGKTLFHCVKHVGTQADMTPLLESEHYRYHHEPDASGNMMVVCFQEQTMELEIERIIDYALAVLTPETESRVA